MSHVAAINLLISKDPSGMQALEAACKELGLTLVKNKTTFEWFGHWADDYSEKDAAYLAAGIKPEDYGKCVHAIQLPGCQYEIGVVNRPDGKGYTLIYDFYGPGRKIMTTLGKGCEKLKQMYGVHKATIAARMRGLTVQRQTVAGDSIKLSITGMR
jgi:hypothetical protein